MFAVYHNAFFLTLTCFDKILWAIVTMISIAVLYVHKILKNVVTNKTIYFKTSVDLSLFSHLQFFFLLVSHGMGAGR